MARGAAGWKEPDSSIANAALHPHYNPGGEFHDLIKYTLASISTQPAPPRVCAVSYLNTVPLVWGFLHDPALRGQINLEFALPSICADRLRSGDVQIGIVPVIEMARQNLEYVRGVGIASDGPVRSILLVSKVPFGQIKTLAT